MNTTNDNRTLATCHKCEQLQAIPADRHAVCWACGYDKFRVPLQGHGVDELAHLCDQLQDAVARYDESDRQLAMVSRRNVQLHAEYARLIGRGPTPRTWLGMHRDFWLGITITAGAATIAQLLRLWGVL